MATYTPIRLAGSELGEHRHVCAFFDTPDDEYDVLFPFFREAMEQGERAVSIQPRSRVDYRARLRAAGVDVDAPRRQFELLCSEDAYASEGRLDVDAMLGRIRRAFEDGRELGYPLTRIAGNGERSLISPQTVDAFLEYETRLNDLVGEGPDPVICVYDVRNIPAGVAFEVLRTHPMAIVRGVLQENPFFVPPAELLEMLHARTHPEAPRDAVRA
jgi:hypothetical protein